MRANPFLFTIVFVSLLTASFAAPLAAAQTGAAAFNFPTAFDAALDDEDIQPHGTWERSLERVTFYLDNDQPFDDQGEAGQTPPLGTVGYYHYEPPQAVVPYEQTTGEEFILDPNHENDKRVVLSQTDVMDSTEAVFKLPRTGGPFEQFDLNPTRPFWVYGFEATLYVSCPGESLPELGPTSIVSVDLRLRELKADGSEGNVRDYDSGSSHVDFINNVPAAGSGLTDGTEVFKVTVQGFENLGNFNLGSGERERVDPASEVLEFAVQMDNYGSCTLHYGSQNFPSNFRLITDTSTVNTWVEDKGGYTVGLPSADSAGASERRMTATFLQASAWPDLNQFQHRLSEPVDYMDQIWTNLYYDNPLGAFQSNPNNPHYGDLSHGDKRWFLRWTNPDEEVTVYDTATGDNDQRNTHIKPVTGDRDPRQVASGLNVNEFQFLYTEDLADGVYRYELYNNARVLATSTPVTVGLKGFSLGLIDSRGPDAPEARLHEVEVDEPTTFLLELRNTGAQADTITLTTTSPGTGWTADLAVDSVALPAGSDDAGNRGVQVPLTVTPSATAKVDDLRTFRVTAASGAFPNEVANQELELRVRVVAEKAKDVELFNVPDEVTVAPGSDFTLAGMFAHNLGTSAQTFLIEAQPPLDARGWTSRATPPARLIEAGSVEPFSLKVNVAADAPSGSSVVLPVTVRLVDDNSVVDTVLVTVKVLLEHNVRFDVSSTLVPMRKAVETCFEVDDTGQGAGREPITGGDTAGICDRDSKSDLSALYRLRFTNPGTVDETYTLKGDWESGTYGGQSVSGIDNCDGSPPSRWRLDYGESHNDVASGKPSHNPQTLETVVVPAGQTVTRYIEMGYSWPSGQALPLLSCVNNPTSISNAAAYRLVATVDSAPGQKTQHTIAAYLVNEDVHTPALERGLDPLTSQFTPEEKESQLVNQQFQEVRYPFVVRNEASEHGTVSVSVRNVHPSEGYSQHLEFLGTPLSGADCAPSSSKTTYTCKGLGVHGEASFELVVKPDASVLSVDSPDLRHTITAVTTDGGASTALQFTTDLVGEFQFGAIAVVSGRDAHPGQEVNLPFQVQNKGTRDDTYSITLSSGDADWRPRMSTDDLVFVAGEHNLEAFLRVQVPETAQVGDTETFQVRIASSDNSKGAGFVTFTVRVVEDAGIVVQGVGGSDQVLMEGRGQPQTVTVEAVDPTSAVGDPITFRVDRNNLPSGWTVQEPFRTGAVTTNVQGHVASAEFVITAPQQAIGTSSVPLIVEACRGDQTACVDTEDFTARGDIILNLQDDVGVFMRLDDPDAVTATLPGGSVVLPVLVQNAGLSADLIDLSSTDAKSGWSISYDPPVLPLAPLESQVVDVIVKTPTSAKPGEKLDFLLFATSRNEPSEFAQLQLSAEIGVFDLEWSAKTKTVSLAPGETHSFVARVHNNGTLPDSVDGEGGLATEAARQAYGSLVDVTIDPPVFELRPGQSRDVVVSVRLATSVPASVTIPVEARFLSLEDPPSTVVPTFAVKVLDYKALDVDGDGIIEFAVDRNGDRGDGYEDFIDSDPSAGKATQPASLIRFLSEEGRLRHTVKVTEDNKTFDRVHLRIDGDPGARNFGDGKTDLMLDNTGDGLPDLYWDPDDGHSSSLSVIKDINADGVPDYFVDTSGNGEFNAVYDLAQGTFLRLLARDVDNDGVMDYAVDKNGNGRVDGDETLLLTDGGKLVQVTKVDVDGDGELDEVWDYDGDGVPDSFIPAGKSKGVPLTVDRDLNEDGFLDWSYDANRDGRDDHYYDPAAQSGGHQIDAQAAFVRNLQEFWYVGALFVLVAALFVVLVAVTRR